MALLAVVCQGIVLRALAEQPLVAVHDSEFTRALESMPATGQTPTGPGTTGNQWWPTNWHYFVMPDAVKEMLRSDGTAFTVVGDSNIMAGALLDGSGHPNYPIVITLASEAVDNSEIARFTNYVAAGGMLFVGSSSFSRNTNGTTRGDFAFASQMGMHMIDAALTNWNINFSFTVATNNTLVSHIPPGQVFWQMPSSSEEISWPEAFHPPNPPNNLPHLVWQVTNTTASIVATGDNNTPYILIQPYGKGWFVYDSAMQPLIGHGGWAPGMYAYGIFRNAIQWAFQNAAMPIPKLSTWPYSYNAAVIFRHDMEADSNTIESIYPSAQWESTNNARGDYFFCTGELRQDMGNPAPTVALLQQAISNYGATIGSHNGGLTNINVYVPPLTPTNYDYWHWGPDEVLNTTPPAGYSNGTNYALISLSNSLNDIQGWFGSTTNGGGVKSWVAPYFNATREASVKMQSQLGIQVSGDDKLGPFPTWTFSTQTPDLRYPLVQLPVSDWFVGNLIAQSMEHHTSFASIEALVDFYYNWGALVNLYDHSASDGSGAAGGLAPNYILYSVAKPLMWSANSGAIYNWWVKRSSVQTSASFSNNGSQSTSTITVSGSTDTNMSVEFLLPANGSICGLEVYTNGTAAPVTRYRMFGQTVKVLVGKTVTNATISYLNVPGGTVYLTQNFDSVTVPALPTGWTSSATGFESPWISTNTLADSPPNALWCKDATNIGTSTLVSPQFTLPTGQAQLSFRNNYDLESTLGSDGFDGGVLEISVNGGPFSDILTAGGVFVSGGYTSTIDTNWGNPLAGRQAWSGASGSYVTTTINLPASTSGQNVQFRWICGTDNGNGWNGWWIDTLSILTNGCNCCVIATNSPVLPAQSNETVSELSQLTVTNTATDANPAPDTLFYSLANPPNGATIDTNGIITWTPTAQQAPSTNLITTVVEDSYGFSATNQFTVVVTTITSPPVLPTQTSQTVNEYSTLTVTNSASDPLVPPLVLTYQLVSPPSGASISSSGIITWTPTRAQSQTTNVITTVVTDNGTPQQSATNSFTVVVNPVGTCLSSPFFQENFDEVTAPNLPTGWTTSATGAEKSWYTTNSQSDTAPNAAFVPDVNNIGSSQLVSPSIALPAGQAMLAFRNKYGFEAPVNGGNDGFDGGVLEIKIGAGSFTDILTAGGAFITGGYTSVIDTNYGNPLAGRQAWSGTNSSYTTVVAMLPAAASGQTIQLRWNCGTDNGNPGAGWRIDTISISNEACTVTGGPLLGSPPNVSVNELAALTVTNAAIDAQVPPLTLNYQLLSPPTGMSISSKGVITWTPTKSQGPATNTVTTVASDNGSPPLSATNSFQVVVNEFNLPPLLPSQTNRTSVALTPMTVTNTATDQNIPPKPLSYGLLAAPAGATIDTNGVIHWTPVVSQVPSTNTITTVVTNTDPLAVNATSLTATNSFTVTITAIHNGPSLPIQGNQTVNELAALNVTNTATDSDIPLLPLTYQLVSPPAGATINTNGIITWTPSKSEGPATNTIKTIVTDAGTPPLSATNSFQVVVNEINLPPLLPAQNTVNSAGLAQVIVTNTATDQNIPPKPLSYGLQAAPFGATIDTNGIIRWTPMYWQVPGTNTITTVVTNTDPQAVNATSLTATNSFTVIINAIHNGPSLPAQSNQSVNELAQLMVTNTAIDSDIPQLDLNYQLVSPPHGANISHSGIITWTPDKSQGPATNTITTIVTDNGTPPLSATNSFQVVVNEINLPPILPIQHTQNSPGLAPVVITNTAFDQNIPPKPMSYGLQVAPVGATIDTNGIIRWTPVASQVPGTNTITTVVTNTDPLAVNATALTATNSFTLIINAIHNGPSLPAQGNQTVNELAQLTVTNTAIDSDVPALALTYQLVSPPAGAAVSTNGVITWTPSKSQGPSTNTIKTIVTDAGAPPVSATNSFQVVVNEFNLPPLLPSQTNRTSIALTPVVVTNTATDQNIPAKPLGYGLLTAPAGAAIDTNGVIHWTPVVSQVPSTNTITTVVTNTDPLAVNATSLTATNSFTVTVTAIHNGPTLSAQGNLTVNELATLTVTNTAGDSDIPALALTYQLVSPPTGASINTNGIITWTPAKAQGPATNTITTIVTDNGTPALSATNSFQVVVNEVNLPPLLPGQGTVVSAGLTQVIVTNTATDQNVPAKPMSYGLQAAPVGASIDNNGIIRWTPVVSQVPGTNTITTVVTNTDPLAVNATALTATNSFMVIINAVHNGPSLPVQTTETVNELAALTVTNTATDSDIPASALTYQLVSPPTGASINTNGIITWTPSKAQGPATNTITTIVTDAGTPPLSATNSFQVVVNEINLPPLLPAQTTVTSAGLTQVIVTNTATDQNIPAKPMSYGLQAAPVGAAIDSSGIIRWTAVASQVPSTNTITTVVTNTDPLAVNATALTATNSFTVIINATHNGPSLPVQSAETVNELAQLTVTNTAVDSDVPALALTYQLVSPPTGANIDTKGIITWTPAKAQGPATNTITTTVTDSGTPALSATNSFQVVVNEINLPPILPAQGTLTSAGLTQVIVTNTATDQNIPAKPMSYGLQAAPVGATIDSSGIVRWTPVASQVPGTNTITTVVTNTDPLAVNATALTATNSFTVIINAIHNPPALPAQSNQAIAQYMKLTVTNAAACDDIPPLALTYQLVSPPPGASIDNNGVITWTPGGGEAQTTNAITTMVTDDGTPPMSATNSFMVVVQAPPQPVILKLTIASGQTTVTWSSMPGQKYELQYKDSQSDTQWSDINPDVVATNSTTSVQDTTGAASQRFYRVFLVPQ
jgi:hypothetical protein